VQVLIIGMIRPTAQRVDEADHNTAIELLEAFRRTGPAASGEVSTADCSG
jgi:hypothetical protein